MRYNLLIRRPIVNDIKAAVIGLGMGSAHIRGYQAHSNVSVVAIADPDSDRLSKIGDEYGIARRYSSAEELFAAEKPDVVSIAVPNFLHKPLTLLAFEHGCHVLCEKPPTETAPEMTEVFHKVRETGLVYQFVRQSRFGQMVQGLKKLIDSGNLGNVYYAKTEWIRDRWFSDKGWRHDASKGGGVLLDLGIHAFDNVWYALGCPRPVEAMASMNTTFSKYAPRDVVYTADDSTMAMIRFEDGPLLCMEVAFSMNTVGRDLVNPADNASKRLEWQQIYVYGDKGAYENGQYLRGKKDGVDVIELEKAPDINPQVAQVKNFFESVQGTASPVNTVEHAVQLMQVLEAAKKSAEQKKTIAIEKIV